MSLKTFEVLVTQKVKVTVDESKFTPEFIKEFQDNFYSFDGIPEHVEHLAQLGARGIVDDFTTFIEGYGPPKEMGIEVGEGEVEEIEILQPSKAA